MPNKAFCKLKPQSSTQLSQAWQVGVIALCLLPLILKKGFYVDFSFGNSNYLHTMLEWSAFCISLFIGVFGIIHYKLKHDKVIPLISVALICAGIMDAFHILSESHIIPSFHELNTFSDRLPKTWPLFRSFHAFILIGGAWTILLCDESSPQQLKKVHPIIKVCFYLMGLFSLVGILYLLLKEDNFGSFVQSIPLLFNLFPMVLILTLGWFTFDRLYKKHPSIFSHALLLSIIPFTIAETAMIFGSNKPFDHYFNVAHYLKVIEYILPLLGVCFAYIQTHQQSEWTYQQLQETHDQLMIEVKERELAEQQARRSALLAVLVNEVSEVSSRSQSFDDALAFCIEKTCQTIGWPVGHVYFLPDKEPKLLEPSNIWYIENEESFKTFKDITMSSKYPPGNGLPGRIISSGKPAWIVDVIQDDNFLRGKRVENLGVQGAFGFPIKLNNKTVAVLEFFSFQSLEPDQEILDVAETLGEQLSNVLERQQTQESLKIAKEAAESSVKAKSEFLAKMSHEIRTPMNGILGLTELTLESELSEENRDNLKMVHHSAESLMEIINDILDFSKIEAGKLEFEQIPFNLRNVLNELIHIMKIKADEKKLELSLSIVPETPSVVVGDPTRVRQILVNLINNAIKFTPSGYIKVCVAPAYQHIGTAELQFSVTDTGIGIPQSSQDKIFDSFTQAEASTERKYAGTGLGLAISKDLVKRMNGEINVHSKLGKGTTFSFTAQFGIPNEDELNAQVNKPTQLPNDLTPSQKQASILLAEDNRINQKVALQTLEKQGYQVTIANNGEEVLEWLEKRTFSLILMDCQMPKMDGYEATRHIREQERITGKHIPIIALTANAMKGAREESLAHGMDGYIAKPFDKQKLFHLINSFLSGSHNGL